MAVTLPKGFDFRLTSGFVTDPADCVAEIATTADYSGGQGYGWEQALGANTRDRSAVVDARLAGMAFAASTAATTSNFRVDLPAAGQYVIVLAVGDQTTGQTHIDAELFDNTTSLGAVVVDGTTLAGQFYDASGALQGAAATWVTSNVSVTKTFASTILRVALSGHSRASGVSPLAHLHIAAVPLVAVIPPQLPRTLGPSAVRKAGFPFSAWFPPPAVPLLPSASVAPTGRTGELAAAMAGDLILGGGVLPVTTSGARDIPDFLPRLLGPTAVGPTFFAALQPPPVAVAGPKVNQMPLTAALSFAGSVSRSISRSLVAALSFSGAVAKQTARAFPAGLTFTGAIAKSTGRALAGGLSFAGTVLRSMSRAVAATLTFAGAVAKSTRRPLGAGVSFAGSVVKQTAKRLAGGLSFSGLVVRAISRALPATLSFTGAVAKQTARTLVAAVLSFTGALIHGSLFNRALSGTLSFAGSIVHGALFSKALTGTLSFAGSFSKQVGKALAGGLSFTGQLRKSFARALAAAVSFAGVVTKSTSRSLAGSVSFAAKMAKAVGKALSASVSFAGLILHALANQVFTVALNAALSFRAGFESSRIVRFVTRLLGTVNPRQQDATTRPSQQAGEVNPRQED